MIINLLFLTMLDSALPASMTAPEIVDRMVQADNDRLAALGGYTGIRRYEFENKKSGRHAGITSPVLCDGAGVKRFDVIEESGSGFVRSHIIRKMIEAEEEASQKGSASRHGLFRRTMTSRSSAPRY